MACLDMYNSEHKNHHRAPVSPRISFSSDFVDIQQTLKQERTLRSEAAPPVSSDFEFSVTNYSMMSADELFFEGRLLPFKDNHTTHLQRTTLRQELLIEEDEQEQEQEDRPISKGRWKGFLGLKKSHSSAKKTDRNDAETAAAAAAEGKRPFRVQNGLKDEGGSSCRAGQNQNGGDFFRF